MAVHRDFGVKNGVLGENGHGKGLWVKNVFFWPSKMIFGLKMGFGEKWPCKGTFWVKMGFWGEWPCKRIFGLKMGFGRK